jgi:hypothetical protein
MHGDRNLGRQCRQSGNRDGVPRNRRGKAMTETANFTYLKTAAEREAFLLHILLFGDPPFPEGVTLTEAQRAAWDNFVRRATHHAKEETHGAGSLRMPMGAIKGIGESASSAIVEERKKNGAYQSLEDFIVRLPDEAASKAVLIGLAKAGALDCLGVKREDVVESAPVLLKWREEQRRNRASGQRSVFD